MSNNSNYSNKSKYSNNNYYINPFILHFFSYSEVHRVSI